jgi:hypothetical protein
MNLVTASRLAAGEGESGQREEGGGEDWGRGFHVAPLDGSFDIGD